MNDLSNGSKDSNQEMDAQDDLLDDIMNIVQNDDNPKASNFDQVIS